MSFTFNSVTGLQPPFELLDEQLVDVPAGHHFHVRNRYLKLLFFTQGEGRIRIDDGAPIPLRPGDTMIFADACDQYYLSHDSRRACRLQLFRLLLSRTSLLPVNRSSRSKSQDDDSLLRTLFSGVQHFPAAQNPDLQTAIATLRTEAEARRLGYRLRISALCMEICVLLARARSGEHESEPTPAEARRFVIERVKSFIITNAGRPLTLDEIAWQAGWSGAHLARVFRQSTGESVFGYLNRVRVNQAKNLLVSTALPVGEVARSAGFSSPAVFARSFQKALGTTAKGYRHSQRPGWVPEERVHHGANYLPGKVEELPGARNPRVVLPPPRD